MGKIEVGSKVRHAMRPQSKYTVVEILNERQACVALDSIKNPERFKVLLSNLRLIGE